MKKLILILILILEISFFIKTINSADQMGIISVNIESDECILAFKQGWNMFSFCSNLENSDIEDVLLPISSQYRYLMRWNTTKQEFDIYSPNQIEKPFTKIDDNETYFIYALENIQLEVAGIEPGPETKNLVRGWTAPSYQYRTSKRIEDIISSIREDFRYFMKWNNTKQEFDIYSPNQIEKPFDKINKGEGHFIYMENNRTWYY